jgi:hypothetical protein
VVEKGAIASLVFQQQVLLVLLPVLVRVLVLLPVLVRVLALLPVLVRVLAL